MEEGTPQESGELSSDERTLAALMHIGGLMTSIVVPLIIWLLKKDESSFLDDQGREALNFQITIFIASMICMVLICVTGGLAFPLVLILMLLDVVFCVIGAIKAGGGDMFRYPMNMRILG